jgi:hypothetical protein
MADQATEHDQIEAIILASSALVMMSHGLYGAWLMYGRLVGASKTHGDVEDYKRARAESSARLLAACKAVDEAMQAIGDICNGCDTVDERGYNDKAFEALDRVFKRHKFDPTPQTQTTDPHAGD